MDTSRSEVLTSPSCNSYSGIREFKEQIDEYVRVRSAEDEGGRGGLCLSAGKRERVTLVCPTLQSGEGKRKGEALALPTHYLARDERG